MIHKPVTLIITGISGVLQWGCRTTTRLRRRLRPLGKHSFFFPGSDDIAWYLQWFATVTANLRLETEWPSWGGGPIFLFHSVFCRVFWSYGKDFPGMLYLVAIFGQLSQKIPHLTSSIATKHGPFHHIQRSIKSVGIAWRTFGYGWSARERTVMLHHVCVNVPMTLLSHPTPPHTHPPPTPPPSPPPNTLNAWQDPRSWGMYLRQQGKLANSEGSLSTPLATRNMVICSKCPGNSTKTGGFGPTEGCT